MKKKNTDFTFIDLFCGIGGFRQAMESIGGRCVFSCDKNKNVRMTYEANYNEVPAKNILKIPSEAIPNFDVLCAASHVSHSASLASKEDSADTRGTMFFEIASIIKYHKPKVVFLENVDNLARHDNGRTLEVILNTLHELGYDVHYKVLNAADYGVAQRRKRIYFVCFLKGTAPDFIFQKLSNLILQSKIFLIQT